MNEAQRAKLGHLRAEMQRAFVAAATHGELREPHDELGHHGPRSPLGPSAGDSVVQVEHVSKEIDLHEPGSVGRMNAMLTAGASQFDPRIWGEAEERRDTSAVYVM